MRKHRDIKLVTTEEGRKYLVQKLNYYTRKFFTKNLLAIEMKKSEVLLNKPDYVGLPILELNKILMYEFWYDYVTPKYGEKAKLCYTDIDSYIVEQTIFARILQKILKLDFILQIIHQIDRYLKKKIKEQLD